MSFSQPTIAPQVYMNTFSFRAEVSWDVNLFIRNMCRHQALFKITSRQQDKAGGFPDEAVELQAAMSLEEMRAIMLTQEDSHVMVESLRECALAQNDLDRDSSDFGQPTLPPLCSTRYPQHHLGLVNQAEEYVNKAFHILTDLKSTGVFDVSEPLKQQTEESMESGKKLLFLLLDPIWQAEMAAVDEGVDADITLDEESPEQILFCWISCNTGFKRLMDNPYADLPDYFVEQLQLAAGQDGKGTVFISTALGDVPSPVADPDSLPDHAKPVAERLSEFYAGIAYRRRDHIRIAHINAVFTDSKMSVLKSSI